MESMHYPSEQDRAGSKNWHEEHRGSLSTGQRAADVLRNGMGSWWFIGAFVLMMALWAIVNTFTLHDKSWDPYPYILLNLFLSMLAGLQGAILLIAAKRQDAISAAMAAHDFETDTAAKAEIDRLLTLGEQHQMMIAELRALIEDVTRRSTSSRSRVREAERQASGFRRDLRPVHGRLPDAHWGFPAERRNRRKVVSWQSMPRRPSMGTTE